MFRAALCPSSGAHDYISDYYMDRLILRLLKVVGYVQVGWLARQPAHNLYNLNELRRRN
jgi:hypothetical protein